MQPRIVPAHTRPLGAVIQFCFGNACTAQQPLFHQPHAGGAGDAAEHEHGFFFVFRQHFYKLCLHFGQVVQFQLCQHFVGRQCGFFGGGGAVVVIAAQPCVDNALGNGLAACAAGGFFALFVTDGEMGVRGDGQAAVETGLRFGHGAGIVCGVQAAFRDVER